MADDKTMICNIALWSVGQDSIASIDANDPISLKMNTMFETIVKELLGEDWFFNRARVQLTQLVTAPAFGTWDYQYSIPADCLYIRGLGDVDYDKIKYPFVREGQYILTNQTEAYLHYNQFLQDDSGVSNVSLMPVWFHRLISARLAHVMAPNITENMRHRQKAEIEWDRAYLFAREKNGEEAYYEYEEGNRDWADGANNLLDTI